MGQGTERASEGGKWRGVGVAKQALAAMFFGLNSKATHLSLVSRLLPNTQDRTVDMMGGHIEAPPPLKMQALSRSSLCVQDRCMGLMTSRTLGYRRKKIKKRETCGDSLAARAGWQARRQADLTVAVTTSRS